MKQFLQKYDLDIWENWAILVIRIIMYGSWIYLGYAYLSSK